eukprot:TRINITY_DN67654_c8_g1_i3.p1 TRINITY_DN67654_c8_g1~~TRINITY_DN67654_c8_g1_i3.p1  ORF type:complete len:200 (-),score=3.76 TRINITY_DN67654_c8_g1_i3:588-1187(-)
MKLTSSQVRVYGVVAVGALLQTYYWNRIYRIIYKRFGDWGWVVGQPVLGVLCMLLYRRFATYHADVGKKHLLDSIFYPDEVNEYLGSLEDDGAKSHIKVTTHEDSLFPFMYSTLYVWVWSPYLHNQPLRQLALFLCLFSDLAENCVQVGLLNQHNTRLDTLLNCKSVLTPMKLLCFIGGGVATAVLYSFSVLKWSSSHW